jgi:5-methyltetrahydropteroyltriglutamate--homocysteine methyltransferase
MTDLTTSVVGSYPQPAWLIDREALGSHSVPRVRMASAWRVPEPFLEEAQDDATRLAIRDMERAGIDTITDGEMRREILQPLRHRAGRHRRRAPGDDPHPLGR